MSENNLDIVDLFKIYSKGIIKESTRELILEKESIDSYKENTSKKCDMILYFDSDPQVLPSSFSVDFNFKVQFNIDKIMQVFGGQKVDVANDSPIDDKEIEKAIDKQIQQKRTGDLELRKMKKLISLDDFKHDFFKKHFEPYAVKNKLNDLVRAGAIFVGDFNIIVVTHSIQMTDELLFNRILAYAKKGVSVSGKEKYGLQLTFEAKNKLKFYNKNEIKDFINKFLPDFENTILKDTEYYVITRQ